MAPKSRTKRTTKSTRKATTKASPKTPASTTAQTTFAADTAVEATAPETIDLEISHPETTDLEITPPETTAVDTTPLETTSVDIIPPETTTVESTPLEAPAETAPGITAPETADGTAAPGIPSEQETTDKAPEQEPTEETTVKPAVKKTIRVVKKVIKKKVPKRVAKPSNEVAKPDIALVNEDGDGNMPSVLAPVELENSKQFEAPKSEGSKPDSAVAQSDEVVETRSRHDAPNADSVGTHINGYEVGKVDGDSGVGGNGQESVPKEEVENCEDGGHEEKEVGNSENGGRKEEELGNSENGDRKEEELGNSENGGRKEEEVGNSENGGRKEEEVGNSENDGRKEEEVGNSENDGRKEEEVGNCEGGGKEEEVENCEGARKEEDVENCEDGGRTEEEEKRNGATRDEEMEVSERGRRRKTEIFIGGLDKDAKEEDLRKVFEKIGEIVEVRLMKNNQTGKNKGYAFLRYATAADAKRALTEYSKVEVCGKLCGTAPVEVNDTIFLGNIDKKWKKEDIVELLHDIGIEKIDTVTVMTDPNNPESNRGFAFLELETNKDAQSAYKKLQKKEVLGKGLNIKVAWAEPLNEPDEEEMLKVKSVYAEGVPSSWDEEKVKKHFEKFGEIDRVVLARNMHSARRKDFAFVNYTTRDAALACIESINKGGLTDEGTKVNVRASLAKPISKGKQNKGGARPSTKDHSKEKPKAAQRDTNLNAFSNKGKSEGFYGYTRGRTSSTTQVLREQASWRPGQISLGRGYRDQDYTYPMPGGKRPLSALGDNLHFSDPRAYPRARLDGSFAVASSSYSTLSQGMSGASLPYHQQSIAGHGSNSPYGSADHSGYLQTRPGAAPYGSGLYRRY